MSDIRYEYEINGKAVVMKRRVENSDARRIVSILSNGELLQDTNNVIPLGVALIESWEFAGKPSNPQSYNKLEYFDEMLPLFAALVEYANARTAAAQETLGDLKN